MKDERITIETAKLLKEKKFNIGVHASYTEYLKTHKSDDPSFAMKKEEVELDESCFFINNYVMSDYSNKNYTMYAAPTQSLVARWLREVHGLQVYAHSNTKNGEGKYKDYVVYINGAYFNDARDEEYDTYEKAMEFGLYNALTQIK
jgi:hypothetical protein